MKNSNFALRLLKVFVLLAAGLFGFFVFLGNLLDYDSNYQFVTHVLSMDTTFEGNKLVWRSIESPIIHTIAYIFLIILEGIFSLLALAGVYYLVKNIKQPGKVFNESKLLGYYAFVVGIGIWFIGFVVIGSEWFAMWQSSIWNGKETAMDIITVFVGFAILYSLPDKNLEGNNSTEV